MHPKEPVVGGRPYSGPWLCVSVSDNGIGIKLEEQSRLFERFVQLDSGSDRKHQGTGLGLSLTRKLVAMHRGYIWAESGGEGMGSTFRFIIPLEHPEGKKVEASDSLDEITPIEWIENYSVGVPSLDASHKDLVEIINQLIGERTMDLDARAPVIILRKLQKYAVEHFREEEALMNQWSYPDIENHQLEHQSFEKRIIAYIEGRARSTENLYQSVLGYLRHWFEKHILEVDMKYKRFIRGK